MFETRRSWDPWEELNQLRSEFERALGRPLRQAASRSQFPPVNLSADADGLKLTAEVPGVDPDSLDVTITGDALTIRGERATEEAAEGDTWYRRERPAGAFERTVELPFEVDAQNVDARCENGVLTLALKRPEEQRPKKVTIRKG